MLFIVWSLLPDNDWWPLPVFLCKLNPIKAHWGTGSRPFSSVILATFPPQEDHVLVDLFSSATAGGLYWTKLPHNLLSQSKYYNVIQLTIFRKAFCLEVSRQLINRIKIKTKANGIKKNSGISFCIPPKWKKSQEKGRRVRCLQLFLKLNYFINNLVNGEELSFNSEISTIFVSTYTPQICLSVPFLSFVHFLCRTTSLKCDISSFHLEK